MKTCLKILNYTTNINYLTARLNTRMSREEFIDIKATFNKRTLLVLPEVYEALWGTNIENILVKEKQLFLNKFENIVTLEEFEKAQSINIYHVRSYI